MSSRIVRVTVRGSFAALTAEQRAGLLARAAEHDVMYAAFTEQGTLTYDVARGPFFTFRFAATVDSDAQIPAAAARAQAEAQAQLAARGLACTGLSAQATDMSQVPLGKRGRREAARNPGR
jgi:hypothetical protein